MSSTCYNRRVSDVFGSLFRPITVEDIKELEPIVGRWVEEMVYEYHIHIASYLLCFLISRKTVTKCDFLACKILTYQR